MVEWPESGGILSKDNEIYIVPSAVYLDSLHTLLVENNGNSCRACGV